MLVATALVVALVIDQHLSISGSDVSGLPSSFQSYLPSVSPSRKSLDTLSTLAMSAMIQQLGAIVFPHSMSDSAVLDMPICFARAN